jgi:type I restriction enzyme M protein
MARRAKKEAQPVTTAQRLGAVLKACRDIMRKDKGLSGDVDRLPMLTWIMFLKFLDDMERVRSDEAALEGKAFRPIIDSPYRWRDWNPPNSEADDGGLHNAMTGDALTAFINQDEAMRPDGERGPGLFAHLRSLDGGGGLDRADVIASVFRGTVNRMQSGYLLRDVLDKVGEMHFSSSDEIHTLSHLYESILKEMRDAAGDSGEFYTPRPLIRMIVKTVDPQPGEAVLDPAAGTGGFLVEAYEHIKPLANTVEAFERLQRFTLYGIEAKPLPYLLCQMNLLLHGIESPQIDPLNALRFRMSEIGDRDRVDVIVTNPPFGGEEEKGIERNFPSDRQTSETALLFLQLIMRKLRRPGRNGSTGGRAGVVVPNGVLFGDGVAARIKKELLENYNLHTIVRLPNGVFAPYTSIPTNVLFFDRSGPTREIWYYEHPLPEGRKNYTKTQPLRFEEFARLLEWWHDRSDTEQAWRVPVDRVIGDYNLDLRNPRAPKDLSQVPPAHLIGRMIGKQKEMLSLLSEVRAAMDDAREIVAGAASSHRPLRELVTVRGGGTPSKANPDYWSGTIPWISPKDMKSRELDDSIDHITEVATVESSAKLLDPGCVLIVTRGMILAHTVPVAVLRVPAAINQDMKALTPVEGISAEYLCAVLWALNAELVDLVERSTHDTRKLQTPTLLGFEVPVPSRGDQERIVSRLAEVHARHEAIRHLSDEVRLSLQALEPSTVNHELTLARRGETLSTAEAGA